MQKKFSEQADSGGFEFQEVYWQQAQELIRVDREKRRRRGLWWWWLGAGLFLLGFVCLFGSASIQTQVGSTDTAQTENEITERIQETRAEPRKENIITLNESQVKAKHPLVQNKQKTEAENQFVENEGLTRAKANAKQRFEQRNISQLVDNQQVNIKEANPSLGSKTQESVSETKRKNKEYLAKTIALPQSDLDKQNETDTEKGGERAKEEGLVLAQKAEGLEQELPDERSIEMRTEATENLSEIEATLAAKATIHQENTTQKSRQIDLVEPIEQRLIYMPELMHLPAVEVNVATFVFKKAKSKPISLGLEVSEAYYFTGSKLQNSMNGLGFGLGATYFPKNKWGAGVSIRLSDLGGGNLADGNSIKEEKALYSFGFTEALLIKDPRRFLALESQVNLLYRWKNMQFFTGIQVGKPLAVRGDETLIIRTTLQPDGNTERTTNVLISEETGLQSLYWSPTVGLSLDLGRHWNMGLQTLWMPTGFWNSDPDLTESNFKTVGARLSLGYRF